MPRNIAAVARARRIMENAEQTDFIDNGEEGYNNEKNTALIRKDINQDMSIHINNKSEKDEENKNGVNRLGTESEDQNEATTALNYDIQRKDVGFEKVNKKLIDTCSKENTNLEVLDINLKQEKKNVTKGKFSNDKNTDTSYNNHKSYGEKDDAIEEDKETNTTEKNLSPDCLDIHKSYDEKDGAIEEDKETNTTEKNLSPDCLDFSDGSSDNYIPNSYEEESTDDSEVKLKRKKNLQKPGNVFIPASDSETSDHISEGNDGERTKQRKKRKSLKERREDRLERLALRNAGKCYFTKTGKFVSSRHMEPLNSCRMKCKERIPESVREHIFNEYWNLGSYDERARYAEKFIILEKKKSCKTDSKRKREYSNKYKIKHFADEYSICKGCLLKTLSETCRFLQTVCEKIQKFGRVPKSEIGRAASYRKISEDRMKNVEQHISKFPAYESHYCRAKTTKKYLSPDLSIESMYELYIQENENPVSKTVYAKVFKDMNLAFKKPSVDTCNKCNLLQAKLKFATTSSSQEALSTEQELQKHQDDYETAYEEKRKDKETAKNDDNTCVFAFDLQQCLPTPMLSTSSAFYKRQLWVYNLTIHDFETNHAYCYMWPESNGGRGANQIASCLYDFIINRLPLLHPDATQAIFYSDSCPGQNKNSIIATMFMMAVENSTQLQSIEHKFLVPGHTHMEVDSDHALIERAKKRTCINIHLPRDWYQLVRTASNRENKFSVIEMNPEEFFDFAEFSKRSFQLKKMNVDGEKFVWSDVRVMKYEKGSFAKFEYKENFKEDDYKMMSYAKKNKIYEYISINAVKRCYNGPQPISVKKKNDLISLLEFIDPSAHDFYHNLLTANDALDIDPDLENDDE